LIRFLNKKKERGLRYLYRGLGVTSLVCQSKSIYRASQARVLLRAPTFVFLPSLSPIGTISLTLTSSLSFIFLLRSKSLISIAISFISVFTLLCSFTFSFVRRRVPPISFIHFIPVTRSRKHQFRLPWADLC